MPCRRILPAVAGLAIALSVAAAPLQKSETLAVGPAPASVAIDTRTRKALIANAGSSRAGGGSLVVLERGGRLTTLATVAPSSHVAVSPGWRKAVALQPAADMATVVNIDTLATTALPIGGHPVKTVIVERSGVAYVLGTQESAAASEAPASFITAIDLRTQAAQSYPMPGFAGEDLVASPDGNRLYVIGSQGARGEWKRGVVQAFDTAARGAIGAPIAVGREARNVMASAAGDKVYVVGHVDYARAGVGPKGAQRDSIRPALHVLAADTLRLERSIDLPDTRNLDVFGPALTGAAALDPDTGRVLIADRHNARVFSVDPASGAQRTTELEAPPMALALDRGAGTVIVAMNGIGQAAILSRGGARLDTVPIGRAFRAGGAASRYDIAVDPASGDAFLTNGHDASLSILKRTGEPAAVVNLTDVWFDAADPGWGLFVDHQGVAMFATLFIHGAAGDPTWLTMSNGVRQADGSFYGMLFRTRGPAMQAVDDIAPVGIMRFTPTAGDGAKLLFVVEGKSSTRTVERFQFDAAPRSCGWSVGAPKSSLRAANFTSLWSDPREPGWGVAVSHQGNTAFAVLFTYDAENRPSWVVMSQGRQLEAGLFTGDLYRASQGRIASVGAMTLDFSAADQGAVAYRIDGVDFRAPISRQVIAPLMTRCTP